jgi:hypothetical protein
MKRLNFQSNLVPLVLSGQKNSTWRLFDDKGLSEGDEIELKEFGKEVFAEAKITKVVEKSFKELDADDKKGHESYTDDEEMYSTYSNYYQIEVGPDTNLKIVWFELTKRF